MNAHVRFSALVAAIVISLSADDQSTQKNQIVVPGAKKRRSKEIASVASTIRAVGIDDAFDH
jgi:hypothetical protein